MLYCDSSALLKIYFVEEHSPAVKELVARTQKVGTCRITWAEIYSAFSRRAREDPAALPVLQTAKLLLSADWPTLDIIEISQALVEQAAAFIQTFGLRGYDGVQLAAGYTAHTSFGPVTFASFDARLNRAAAALGMTVPFVIA